MTKKTFQTTIFYKNGDTCFIPIGFDPREVFGRVRVPVKVTLCGYTFRSTIASMGGVFCIPLRKSNREAAGLKGGEHVSITLEHDREARTVALPEDLEQALTPSSRIRWNALSFTRQREHVEAVLSAVKPETRLRRIEKILKELYEDHVRSKKHPQT